MSDSAEEWVRTFDGIYRGEVTNNQDPFQNGRVRFIVPDLMGDEELDWARPKLPSPVGGLQSEFIPPPVGAGIWVAFESGNPDRPVYGGGWSGEPGGIPEIPPTARGVEDASSLGKGTDTFLTLSGGQRDEPAAPFAATYPNNRVLKTASGHVIEYDDTPGEERIHIFHKSGTFFEAHSDGTVVARTKGRSYKIVDGDADLHIQGDFHLKIDGQLHFDATKINLGGIIQVARVGDLVAIGTGSSAGSWPIITGSGKLLTG